MPVNPETRARVLGQLSGTEGVTTALATVEEQSSLTLGDPAAMTNDQLADIVIDGVKKLRTILPSIIELKDRFGSADRYSTNRLKEPIKGCYSWKEFCDQHLDRTPRAINKALAMPAAFVRHSPEWNETHPQLAEEHEQIKAEGLALSSKFKTPTKVRLVGGERIPSYSVQKKFKTREEVERFAEVVNGHQSSAPQALPNAQPVVSEAFEFSRRRENLSEVAAQPIVDAEFGDVPQPAPTVDAPLTVKSLLTWKTKLDHAQYDLDGCLCDSFGFVPVTDEQDTQTGRIDALFNDLTPAIAKKLAEYYLQLTNDTPQPTPPAEEPSPAPKPSPAVPVMHQHCGSGHNQKRTWCRAKIQSNGRGAQYKAYESTTCVKCIAAIAKFNALATPEASQPTPPAANEDAAILVSLENIG